MPRKSPRERQPASPEGSLKEDPVHVFLPPAKLGIGLSYQPGLQPVIEAGRDLIDFFEISPDVLCHERVYQETRVLDYHPTLLSEALRWCANRLIVVHGLGLSIGSAAGWNDGYLRMLDDFHVQRAFPWHSEHLAFMLTMDVEGRRLLTGIPLPLPFTEVALDLVVPRAEALGRRYGTPFLLENLTYYLPGLQAEGQRDESTFLNDLTTRSGGGLLLDLYNWYCNAVNFGFDPLEALQRLRLDRVVEIHLAGGASHDGFLLDVPSRAVPEPVWTLLDWVVPRAPHLAGIVYEVMEQVLPIVGVEGVCQQLARTRHVWEHAATASHREGGDGAA